MNKIIDFFIRRVDTPNTITLKKAKALVAVLLIAGTALLSLFLKILIFDNLAKTQASFFSIIILSVTLVLIQRGRYHFAANFLSVMLVAVLALSMFTTKEYAEPYYFFIHYLLFFVYVIFSAMFADRWVLIFNTSAIIIMSVLVYMLRKDLIPENTAALADFGIYIYIFGILMVFLLSFLFTSFINQSMRDLNTAYDDAQKQNQAMEEMIERVKVSAEQFNEAGMFLTELSTIVAKNAETEASQAEEISASMEEMMASITESSQNAESSYGAFKESTQAMEQNSGVFMKTVELIRNISQRISLIEDIAFQTNLLSLNASIQSDKAGIKGKGFAVVAEEIRRLSTVTKQISFEIEEFAKSGFTITQELRGSLDEVLKKNISSLKHIEDINSAGKQQKSNAAAVTESVSLLSQITNKNSNTAEQMAKSAKSLSNQAKILNTTLLAIKSEQAEKN